MISNYDGPLRVKYVIPKNSEKKPFYIIEYCDSKNGFSNILISKGLIDYVTNDVKGKKTNEKRNEN